MGHGAWAEAFTGSSSTSHCAEGRGSASTVAAAGCIRLRSAIRATPHTTTSPPAHALPQISTRYSVLSVSISGLVWLASSLPPSTRAHMLICPHYTHPLTPSTHTDTCHVDYPKYRLVPCYMVVGICNNPPITPARPLSASSTPSLSRCLDASFPLYAHSLAASGALLQTACTPTAQNHPILPASVHRDPHGPLPAHSHAVVHAAKKRTRPEESQSRRRPPPQQSS